MGNTIGLPSTPRGNTLSLKLVVSANGQTIDISGYSFAFIAAKTLDAKVAPPVFLQWDQHPDPTHGVTAFTLETAAYDSGNYFFNVTMQDLVGAITTILAGTWPIVPVPGVLGGGAASPIPPTPPVRYVTEAPVDGLQYGRQSAVWTLIPAPGIYDAPMDSRLYGRENGLWIPVPPSGVAEAPSDGQLYARGNASWVTVPPAGIADAPTDGQQYIRQSGAWSVLPPQIDYSLNEQDTNIEWVDGSKIYQKTVNIAPLPGLNQTKTVPHGISAIKYFIDARLIANAPTYAFAMHWVDPWTALANLNFQLNLTNIEIDTGNIDRSACTWAYLTLLYTCTNR